jgi:hypothetical protein
MRGAQTDRRDVVVAGQTLSGDFPTAGAIQTYKLSAASAFQ